MEEGLLDDGILTEQESERLRLLCLQFGKGGKTREQQFRENKAGYGEFAYRLGLAYFYEYGGSAGKKNAKPWLEAAALGDRLGERQKSRAGRLYAIAEYYARIGQANAAGDELISYGQYWADLRELTRGDLVAEDNARTALVMYRELVGQILARGAEFRKAGVLRKDLEETLEELRVRLEEDFEGLPQAERDMLAAEKDKLKEQIRQAYRLLESIYGRRE